jgi:hypothetical protein
VGFKFFLKAAAVLGNNSQAPALAGVNALLPARLAVGKGW